MQLTEECEVALLRVARFVSDDDRDQFFDLVATDLRPLREIGLTDIRYAASSAVQILRPQHAKRQRAS